MQGQRLPGDLRLTGPGAALLPSLWAAWDRHGVRVEKEACHHPLVLLAGRGSGPQIDQQSSPGAGGPERGRGSPGLSAGPTAEPGEGRSPGAWFANPHAHTPPPGVRVPSGRGGATDNSFQELPDQASHWAASLLEWLGVPNILLEEVPDVPPKSYSCQFKVSNLSR